MTSATTTARKQKKPTGPVRTSASKPKNQLVVLGLNAGTSADGLDLAAVRITRRGSRVDARFLAGARRAYPNELRELVLQAADGKTISIDNLVLLNEALGEFFGRTAAQFQRKLAAKRIKVDLVASHGQTVRHIPGSTEVAGFDVNGSLQLGSPERICAATGCVTAADFRQADIALGGEGAPITTAAMARLFGDTGRSPESRLLVNIGGMSNYFYFPAKARSEEIQAADCGPGNSLCDILAQRLCNEKYDRGGRRALAGKVSQRLLSLLLADPFFTTRTVSTGRETFGLEMVERIEQFGREFKLPADDLIATAAELTAVAIAESVWLLIDDDPRLSKLYLTGGGVHNKFFTRRLAQILDAVTVTSVRDLGFDPGLVEASAYAVMGEACLRGEAMPTRFDGDRPYPRPVSGRLIQPPQG